MLRKPFRLGSPTGLEGPNRRDTRRFNAISLTSREWIKRTASVLENGLSVSGVSALVGPCAIHIVSARLPLRRAPPDQSTMM
jgi:hypothetical protein